MDDCQRTPVLKPVHFVADTREGIRVFPDEVRRASGHALQFAQRGEKSPNARPLKGYRGAGVLEIVEDYGTDTYRVVYTVRFEGIVYVLHAFQKKSPSGRRTAGKDLALIRERLKRAEEHYRREFLPARRG